MQVKQTEQLIATPDGQMPAYLFSPIRADSGEQGNQAAILLLMEAFGVTSHIQEIATRIAQQGYMVLIPDLYYRDLPNNRFGYDQVEAAMAMMWRLDLNQSMENDLRSALAELKAHPAVDPDRIGVTGFCLGGGLTFFTACRCSDEITAAAAFYGMILDEWFDAMPNITVPIQLFFGGQDPFIPLDRIQQIQARLQALGKDYQLQIYPNAGHGFFCDERSDYHPAAAADAWQRWIKFFDRHLNSINT
ncbi:MAG: dienelactone hydrolase family protein [Elainella sp. Prado103]|jgi:carboxymethylenebutenolidase|nr:dienelactone hydrolase family protein [Elainella sp. Prado103]